MEIRPITRCKHSSPRLHDRDLGAIAAGVTSFGLHKAEIYGLLVAAIFEGSAGMMVGWRTRSLIFSMFDVLGPWALHFAQKHFSNRNLASVNKALHQVPKAWAFHRGNIEKYRSKALVEFGAGKHLGQNLYLADVGVKQCVVDLDPMVDLSLVNRSIEILRNNHSRYDLEGVSTLEELRTRHGIDYRAPVDMACSGFADSVFDICVSTHTIEHIPGAQLTSILCELRRVLQPNGIVSACIDYSDHYAHSDRRITKLNYLRYSPPQWRRFNHRFFYQNRFRHEHYRRLFERVGFVVLHDEAFARCKNIPEDLDKTALTGSDSDYCTRGNWVLRNSLNPLPSKASHSA